MDSPESTIEGGLGIAIRRLAWNLGAFWLILGVMLLEGCTTIPDVCYHCTPEPRVEPREDIVIAADGWGACRIESDGKALNCESVAIPLIPTPYHQAWMEYREAGTRHNRQQVDAILNWIKEGSGPLHVVVYIHGWHNNADTHRDNTSHQDPKHNAEKFPFLMARTVDSLKRLALGTGMPMPKVLGIYVGWRGEKYPHGLPNLLSIDGRSVAADIIGLYGDVRNDLTRIAEGMQQRSESSRLMVVGHSLGGRMLTSMFRRQFDQGNPQPLGPGSLIVTLNPAVGADCYDGVFAANPHGFSPSWINITSEDDDATGWIYWSASHLSLVQDCSPDSDAAGVAIGHYADYRNVALHAAIVKDNVPWHPCLSAIEPNWFNKLPELDSRDGSRRFALYFPTRSDTNFTQGPGKIVTLRFEPEGKNHEDALHHAVWNVRTDKTLIDFERDNGLDGQHNGYVNTVLIRILTEILYAGPNGSATPLPLGHSTPKAGEATSRYQVCGG